MILYDFHCKTCQHTWEDLISKDEAPPPCPECTSTETEQVMFCNKPTAVMDPKRAEITMKGRNIRNKLLGKVPWRKHSESQSD